MGAVITDSDVSKADVIEYLKVDGKKVHRVYLAASEDISAMTRPDYIQVLKKYDLEKPYFLYVGDINYNKNLLGLIEAFGKFSDNFDLVMVSKAMANDIAESVIIKELIGKLRLKGNVKKVLQKGLP